MAIFGRFENTSRSPMKQRRKSASSPTRLGLEALEERRMFATFDVNTSTDDNTPNNGLLSIREAIVAANDNNNQASTVDNIRFIGVARNATHPISFALPTITEPVNIEVEPRTSRL
jgi:hypothetical protein